MPTWFQIASGFVLVKLCTPDGKATIIFLVPEGMVRTNVALLLRFSGPLLNALISALVVGAVSLALDTP